MSIRVRPPASDRLPLSGDDWLLVKRYLNAGEMEEVRRAIAKPVRVSSSDGQAALERASQQIETDLVAGATAWVVTYLLDWSFQHADGSPLVIRDQPASVVRQALHLIDFETYTEVLTAIMTHHNAIAEQLALEKKNPIWTGKLALDLDLCRAMNWTYDDVQHLPQHVYEALVEKLTAEAERAERRRR